MLANLPTVVGVVFAPMVEAPDYAVGDDGSLWTPFGRGQTVATAWKRTAIYRRPYGARYMVVCLRLPSNRKKVVCRYVHKLVMDAFVGPCPEGQEVLHEDNDTANNTVSNLRYGTRVENTADKFRHGTFVVGSRHHNAKLTEDEVRAIRQMRSARVKIKTLAGMYGVSTSIIGCIVHRRGWVHVE